MARKARTEMLEAIGTVDDDAEAFRDWEAQQIRIGATTSASKSEPVKKDFSYLYSGNAVSQLEEQARRGAGASRRDPTPHPSLSVTTETMVTSLHRRLSDTLVSMQEVHSSHVAHLARVVEDLSISEHAVPELDVDLKASSVRYEFFSELRGYIRDMLSCLDEKVPLINECESQIHLLWKERADAAMRRAAQLARDDIDEALAGVPGFTQKQPTFDEMGQNIAAARRTRMQAAAVAGPAVVSDDEGEDPTEVTRRASRGEECMRNAGLLFADVMDEFCEINLIAKRFEAWKFQVQPHHHHLRLVNPIRSRSNAPLHATAYGHI